MDKDELGKFFRDNTLIKANDYLPYEHIFEYICVCVRHLGKIDLSEAKVVLRRTTDQVGNNRRYIHWLEVLKLGDTIAIIGYLKYEYSRIYHNGQGNTDKAALDRIPNTILNGINYCYRPSISIQLDLEESYWCQLCGKVHNNPSWRNFVLCDECAGGSEMKFYRPSEVDEIKVSAFNDGKMKTIMQIHDRQSKLRVKAPRKKLYLIHVKNTNRYKIGVSSKPEERLKNLQTSNSNELALIHVIKCKNARQLESELHNRFSHCRLSGEWFELSESQVDEIKKTA